MLGGFIEYLRKCDWKDRGSHAATVTSDGQRLTINDARNNDSRIPDSKISDQ